MGADPKGPIPEIDPILQDIEGRGSQKRPTPGRDLRTDAQGSHMVGRGRSGEMTLNHAHLRKRCAKVDAGQPVLVRRHLEQAKIEGNGSDRAGWCGRRCRVCSLVSKKGLKPTFVTHSAIPCLTTLHSLTK